MVMVIIKMAMVMAMMITMLVIMLKIMMMILVMVVIVVVMIVLLTERQEISEWNRHSLKSPSLESLDSLCLMSLHYNALLSG